MEPQKTIKQSGGKKKKKAGGITDFLTSDYNTKLQ